MEDDLFISSSQFTPFTNAESVNSEKNDSVNEVLVDKTQEKEGGKEKDIQPEVDEDGDSVDILNSSAAELIVLDESGGEEEGGNGEIVKAQAAADKGDSDIEIVSDRMTPVSVDSIDSMVSGGVTPCSCQSCPYKKKLLLRHAEKSSKSQRKLKWKNWDRVVDVGQSGTVQIRFSDASLFTKYAKEVDEFVKCITDAERTKQEVASNSLDQFELGCSLQLYDRYCVDRKGLKESPFTSKWTKPLFEQQFSDPLNETSFCKTPTEKKSKGNFSCFNCLGNHTINDCTEPHDRQRIANNRNEYRSRRQNMNYARYHVDDSSRFSRFRPGNISNQLRRALGLELEELPLFIYKMRIFGYPPGWLKEAEIQSSGITVYDSNGTAIGEQLEDGEVSDSRSIRVQYDSEKLVDFPGFNTVLSGNIRDESKRLGFPPMQQRHSRSLMEMTMKAPEATPFKRKGTNSTPSSTTKRQKVSPEGQNMDIEEIHEVLEIEPNNESVASEPPTSQPLSHSRSNGDKDSPCINALTRVALDVVTPNSSPVSKLALSSLEDLESAKQKLMLELNDSKTVVEGDEEDGESVTNAPPLLEDECRTPKGTTTFLAASKAMHLGSPAIYQASCFTKLPVAEKFADGISEHLNFENLPDSTGNFDKMREVLQHVRERMATL